MGVLCDGCAARTVLQLCWAGRGSRLLIFAGFELGVIFRRKNMLTLQLFAGVNVPGLFLLVLPACAFLPGDVRNALLRVLRLGLRLILVLLSLLLGVALHGCRQCYRKSQQDGDTTTQRAARQLRGSQVADPGWGVKIRTCHAKPLMTGTTPRTTVYLKRPFQKTTSFSRFFQRSTVARSGIDRGPPRPCAPGRGMRVPE